MKNIITVEIESKSMIDLRKEFNIGSKGFFNNGWWLKQDFAKSIPRAGTYEVNIKSGLVRTKGQGNISKNWEIPHSSVITQVMLKHNHKISEALVSFWDTAVILNDSDYLQVLVFRLDPDHGLFVFHIRLEDFCNPKGEVVVDKVL